MLRGRSEIAIWLRTLLVSVVAILVIIIFIPLVSLAHKIATLEQIAIDYNWLSWVSDLPGWLLAAIQGVGPIILVTALYAMVVPVFSCLARCSGSELKEWIHIKVMWMYLGFLFVNGLVAPALIGSISPYMRALFDHPNIIFSDSSYLELLTVGIPQVSTFFVLFIVNAALVGASRKLCLPYRYVMRKLKLCFARTDFDIEEASYPIIGETRFGAFFGMDTYVFLVCTCYAPVAPITVAAGVVYFALHVVSNRYLFAYHFRTDFDSGGVLGLSAVRALLGCLSLGTIFQEYILYKRDASAPAWSLAPLAFLHLLGAVLVDRCGPGRLLRKQTLIGEVLAVLDYRHTEYRIEEKLQHDHEAGHFAQPSFAVNFDDPVRDRFDWDEVDDENPWRKEEVEVELEQDQGDEHDEEDGPIAQPVNIDVQGDGHEQEKPCGGLFCQ
mmetsp:Transcript_64694/g.127905  ORF Transcript_64694/g.127905 Transcript_64694/m.127905 type:complete len:440 (-) Transcript_64694:89-1408(-)